MRTAADISGRSLAKVTDIMNTSTCESDMILFARKTMRFTRPGISESALAAHFEYLCCLSGSQRLAYVPVVASG